MLKGKRKRKSTKKVKKQKVKESARPREEKGQLKRDPKTKKILKEVEDLKTNGHL